MKFTSFLFKLFVHIVLWSALTIAFNLKEVGIENLAAFVIGFSGFSTLMFAILGDGMRTIPVPGSRLGKVTFLLFHWSRWGMVVSLAAHAHFVAAFVLALSALLIYSAYAHARKVERSIKQAWHDAHASLDAFAKQTAAGAPLEPVNTTTLEPKTAEQPAPATLKVGADGYVQGFGVGVAAA